MVQKYKKAIVFFRYSESPSGLLLCRKKYEFMLFTDQHSEKDRSSSSKHCALLWSWFWVSSQFQHRLCGRIYTFQAANVTIYKIPQTFSQRNTFVNLTIFVQLQNEHSTQILVSGKIYLPLVFACRPIIFSLLGVTCFGFRASKAKIPSSILPAEPEPCPTSHELSINLSPELCLILQIRSRV